MNGAEAVVRTLLAGGVDTCFANPGTSEMHFVAALDRSPGMRSILCLFEGVATGAADGFGRMADRPAVTLLHLGPGLAYGTPNLHNARRARTPVLNIVGEHADYHKHLDAPLNSDIESLSSTVSGWTRTAASSKSVAEDAAEALCVARKGVVATLICPANAAWDEAAAPAEVPSEEASIHRQVIDTDRAGRLLRQGRTAIILGDSALAPENRALAAGIARMFGASVFAPTSNRRIDRGYGTIAIDRIPYPVSQALEKLRGFKAAILIGATEPVAFFAYPDRPGRLLPDDCEVLTLASPHEECGEVIRQLAARVGASPVDSRSTRSELSYPPDAALTAETIGPVLAACLPEDAIVCDESISVGRSFFKATENANRHTWLQITGGAIGCGLPLATGASVACPDRKTIALVGDGSSLYTVQALWTLAREQLDVVVVVLSNRSYAILKGELDNVGAQTGPLAESMLTLDSPAIDWVRIAEGFGVPAECTASTTDLGNALRRAFAETGPQLIVVDVA